MSRVQVRPTAKTRQRRRRRRAVTFLAYLVIVGLLAWYFESQGTTTIVFVRHAEVDQEMSADADAPLNVAGRARAERLAEKLIDFDVTGSVNAIYADETRRTIETAAPLAERTGLSIHEADHDDVFGFMRDVLRDHKREIVLVVTHKDRIAPLVEELHGSKNIGEIASSDYDDIYIVIIPWNAKVKTLHIPY